MSLKKEFVESLDNNELIKTEEDFLQLLELLDKENDVNKQIGNGETLLHLAVWEGYVDVVKELLKKGANINLPDTASSRTPIHLAVKRNNIKMVKILLDTNYDYFYYSGFSIKDLEYNTPLMIAEKQGYPEIVELLKLDNIIDKIKNKSKEQLEKCQYDEENEKVIYRNFEDNIHSYKKLTKEIEILNKDNERLKRKKSSKSSKSSWLKNLITFGFFSRKIVQKMMKNTKDIFTKRTQLNEKKEKLKNITESIKEKSELSEVKKAIKYWMTNFKVWQKNMKSNLKIF
ncbi:ankyrin repeat domain-containing protein [Spiroplasma endosymbiont of Nebria brevicollis]|uniref:ankyrin repeat domain-containing protein n=1 Tax=Spiroplasma endosymbiont of Nebria brevicollis TaxID=3066284 RepID=UPI00313C2B48